MLRTEATQLRPPSLSHWRDGQLSVSHGGGHVLSEGARSIPQSLSPTSEPATDAVCDLPRAPHRIPHKAFTPVGVRVRACICDFAPVWSWCASGALNRARFDCAGSLATGSCFRRGRPPPRWPDERPSRRASAASALSPYSAFRAELSLFGGTATRSPMASGISLSRTLMPLGQRRRMRSRLKLAAQDDEPARPGPIDPGIVRHDRGRPSSKPGARSQRSAEGTELDSRRLPTPAEATPARRASRCRALG
jgi:hypothetical protein